VLACCALAACSDSHLPPPTVLPLAPGAPLRIEIDLPAGATFAEAHVTGGGTAATGPFEVAGTSLHGVVRIEVAAAVEGAWLTLPFVADLDGQPNDEPRLDTTRTAVASDGLRGIFLGDLAAGETRDVEIPIVSPLGARPPAHVAIGGFLRDDLGPPAVSIELEDAFRAESDGFYVSRNRPVFTGDGYAVVPAASEGSSRTAAVWIPRAGRYRAHLRQISASAAARVDLALGTLDARLEATGEHRWVDLGETELEAGEVALTLTTAGDDRLGLDALALVPAGGEPPGPSGLDATAGALDPAIAGASLPDAIASRLAPAATAPPEELRRALRVAMSLEPLPTAVPEHEVVDVVDDGPCSLELLWFDGGHGPVPANLYVPDDTTEPGPAILNPIGHWAGGKAREVEQLRAAGFCRLGFVSMTFDTYWQGERAGERDNHFLGTFDVLAGDSFAGMLLGESVRAVSLLASRPEVDPERIGVTGASGGGMVSAALAAIDDRIAAAAPVVYTTDWEWLLLESLQGDPDQIPFGAALEAPLPAFWATIAPRPLLFITAEEDGIFPPSVARRVFAEIEDAYAAAGAAGLARLEIVSGGHGYGDDARRLAFDFFLGALAGGGAVGDLPRAPVRSAEELAVDPPLLRTLVDVHVERALAIDAAPDRARLAAVLALPGGLAGAARRVAGTGFIERWALDVDGGREVSALVIGPVPAREVVVVAADGGVAGATVVPWLVGPERAVVVVEPTGIGSQMGPYSAVVDAGFGGFGKYAGGHPLLVGLTGMALLSAGVHAAAALAREALGAERVVLCGEGLGSGGAVLAIAAADPDAFDAVVGVDGFASYREVAAHPAAPPPALLARSLFDVGDLPDLATLVAPRPLLLVAPRDASLAVLPTADAQALYPDGEIGDVEQIGAWLDAL
jgi:dienelactone hydrolase